MLKNPKHSTSPIFTFQLLSIGYNNSITVILGYGSIRWFIWHGLFCFCMVRLNNGFTFALSSLSRYKIVEWSNLLRGLKNDFVVDVQRYMQSIQVFFPLIICSYIFCKKLIPEFYPTEISELD